MSDKSRRMSPRSARSRGANQRAEAERVTTSAAYGREETEREDLGGSSFPPGVEPAFVRVSAGGTYNLGNFESLRLDVSVTIPCRPDRIDRAYQQASEFVAEKLGEEESNWMGKKR